MAAETEDRAAIRRQILVEGRRFQCDICLFDYPESSLRIQSGRRVSTLCCWEPGGGDVERELMAADARVLAAELTKKQAQPGKYPGRRDGLGSETLSLVSDISPDPVEIGTTAGPISVVVTGRNLTASTTFDFGHASLTASAVVDSETQITLALSSVAVPRGDYDLTIDSNTVWRDRIRVR